MTNIAIENGTFIVDLPIKDGDFPVRKLLVYQRVGRIRVLVFWKMMLQYHTGGISRGCGCNLVTSWDSPGQMWSLPTVPNCHSRETNTLFTSIFTRQAVIIFLTNNFWMFSEVHTMPTGLHPAGFCEKNTYRNNGVSVQYSYQLAAECQHLPMTFLFRHSFDP